MARTDVHSPTNLVTEDYTFEACFDNEPPALPGPMASAQVFEAYEQAIRWWRSEFERLLALVKTSDVKRGLAQCHHCGAHFRYSAIMKHEPSGTWIAIGETCLENRFELATAEFQRLRKAAKLDKERRKRLEYIEQFVQENPDLAFMALHPTNKDFKNTANDGSHFTAYNEGAGASIDNVFVADVARKLVNYGELSVRQIEAVRKAVKRDAERAQAKSEEAPAGPVPVGAQTIEGEVVGLKDHYTDFGVTLKMTVKLDNGSRVWVTAPSNIRSTVERGNRVRFNCSITASDKDATFGFGKRPTKAVIV